MQGEEAATGEDGGGTPIDQPPPGGDEGVDQAMRLIVHDAVRRGAGHDLVEHRKGERRRIADVARDARKARLEHDDAERPRGAAGQGVGLSWRGGA